MITYKLKINCQEPRVLVSDMEFVAGDVHAYRLEFTFYDNGERVNLSNKILTVKGRRADGVILSGSGQIDGTQAVFVPANAFYAVPGELILEIALTDSAGNYTTTKILSAAVLESLGEPTEMATTNVSAYVTLLHQLTNRLDSADRLIAETKSFYESELAEVSDFMKNKPAIANGEGVGSLVGAVPDSLIEDETDFPNTATADNAVTFGKSNINRGKRALVTGKGNVNTGANSIVAGQYNAGRTNTLLELGNGASANDRSNAFEVYTDGAISLDNGETILTPASMKRLVTLKDEIDDMKDDHSTLSEKVDELTLKLGGVAGLSVDSWENIQRIVRLGLAPDVFSIGDQFTCKRGDTTLVWDVIGIDHDIPTDKTKKHSLTLQLHDCLSSLLQYDNTEALFYAEKELPAGIYNFTLLAGYDTAYGGGKTYSFTLTKPVPTGGVILFPWGSQKQAADTKISTYDSVTSTTVIESVSVTEGANGTALESVGECNHTHRIRYGSNNWMQSALRQYLNSNAAAGSVWTPKTNFDRPPSWAKTTAGFLNGLDADFLAVIGEVDKNTTLDTLTDGGGSETNAEKFFLLSRSEIYGGKENGVLEGDAYPYYSETSDLSAAGTGADTNRMKYRDGAAQYWWLRSPYTRTAHDVRSVSTAGNVSDINAYYSYGVVPACCII